VALQRVAEGRGGRFRVGMRAAGGLGDDFVDDTEAQQVLRRDLERLGGPLALAGVLPQNGGAASGEMTEYTEFSNIKTRSARPTASAPPEPPSPITAVMIGVLSDAISMRLEAIASAWPRSSAPRPGYAPAYHERE